MRAYVFVSGVLFGLLVVAHVWRMFAEEPALARDPWYLSITLAAAALCLWAWRAYRENSR
jgi:hypothetical protein